MSSCGHSVRRCVCGIVLEQCRCPAIDKPVFIVRTCTHGDDAPLRVPLVQPITVAEVLKEVKVRHDILSAQRVNGTVHPLTYARCDELRLLQGWLEARIGLGGST